MQLQDTRMEFESQRARRASLSQAEQVTGCRALAPRGGLGSSASAAADGTGRFFGRRNSARQPGHCARGDREPGPLCRAVARAFRVAGGEGAGESVRGDVLVGGAARVCAWASMKDSEGHRGCRCSQCRQARMSGCGWAPASRAAQGEGRHAQALESPSVVGGTAGQKRTSENLLAALAVTLRVSARWRESSWERPTKKLRFEWSLVALAVCGVGRAPGCASGLVEGQPAYEDLSSGRLMDGRSCRCR